MSRAAILMCFLASGCSIALEHHRSLGAVADVAAVAGAGLMIAGSTCDRSSPDCIGTQLEGHYAGGALLATAVAVGMAGLILEQTDGPEQGARRPEIPLAIDPDTRALAQLARDEADRGRCTVAVVYLDQLRARDAVYGRILVASGAVDPCR